MVLFVGFDGVSLKEGVLCECECPERKNRRDGKAVTGVYGYQAPGSPWMESEERSSLTHKAGSQGTLYLHTAMVAKES